MRFLIIIICLFFSCSNKNIEDEFYIPSLGYIKPGNIKKFMNTYELEFNGYEGLLHKIKDEEYCFKLVPNTKSSQKFYELEYAETEYVINKIGDQQITSFELIFCSSLAIEQFHGFVNKYFKSKSPKVVQESDIIKVYDADNLLIEGNIGKFNSKIVSVKLYGSSTRN